MKKIGLIFAMGFGLMIQSGCASYMTYKGSEKKVAMIKALQEGDPQKIKALEVGKAPDEAGVEVGIWETISHRPYRQAGAAVLDAGMAYLAKEGLDSIGGEDDSDAKSNSADRNIAGANNIITQGNGNTISINTSTTDGLGAFEEPQNPELVPVQ